MVRERAEAPRRPAGLQRPKRDPPEPVAEGLRSHKAVVVAAAVHKEALVHGTAVHHRAEAAAAEVEAHHRAAVHKAAVHHKPVHREAAVRTGWTAVATSPRHRRWGRRRVFPGWAVPAWVVGAAWVAAVSVQPGHPRDRQPPAVLGRVELPGVAPGAALQKGSEALLAPLVELPVPQRDFRRQRPAVVAVEGHRSLRHRDSGAVAEEEEEAPRMCWGYLEWVVVEKGVPRLHKDPLERPWPAVGHRKDRRVEPRRRDFEAGGFVRKPEAVLRKGFGAEAKRILQQEDLQEAKSTQSRK